MTVQIHLISFEIPGSLAAASAPHLSGRTRTFSQFTHKNRVLLCSTHLLFLPKKRLSAHLNIGIYFGTRQGILFATNLKNMLSPLPYPDSCVPCMFPECSLKNEMFSFDIAWANCSSKVMPDMHHNELTTRGKVLVSQAVQVLIHFHLAHFA